MSYKKPLINTYSAMEILEKLGPCKNQYITAVFNTITGNGNINVDGYITKKTPRLVNHWNAIRVGDEKIGNDVLRGFVGFDISSLQDKNIVSATLRLYQGYVNGNPYSDLGSVQVDHVNFGNSLDENDFDSPALTSNIGTISNSDSIGWKTLDVTAYVRKDLNEGRTSSQYRLYFPNDTDGDNNRDQVAFEDADKNLGTEYIPQLVVIYKT